MSAQRTEDAQQEGREGFLSRLLVELQEPSALGVVVMGEAGAGKTTVAGELATKLAPGTVTLRVRGSAVLSVVPFGALSAHLQGLTPETTANAASAMRRVVRRLSPPDTHVSAARLPLLLIDDAHDLDEDTVALLVQLIAGRKARALILACPLPGLSRGFEELVTDGVLGCMTMEPLTLREVEDVCTSVLGGPVVSAVAQAAADATGGNPRLLHAFVRDGVVSGYLRERNGVWHVASQLPPVSPGLRDLVQVAVAPLGQEEKQAMVVLALAEPATPGVVSQLIDHAVLRRLLDASLVRTTAEGLLVLMHPVDAAALRAATPTAKRVRLQREILAVTSPPPRDDDQLLRYVSLALDVGVPVDDGLLLRAATVANRLHDGRLALRALQAIESPRLRGPRLLEMAWAESSNDIRKALELVEEVLAPGTDKGVLRDAIILSLILTASSGGLRGDMDAEVERWQDLLCGADGSHSSSVDQVNMQFLTVVRHVVGASEGTASENAVRMVAVDETADRQTRIAAFLVLAVGLMKKGRPADASTMAARAIELTTKEAGALTLRDHAAGLHIVALLLAGEGDQARSALRSIYRRDAGSIHFFAGWSEVVEGVLSLQEGRFAAAQSRLLLASEALRTSDHLLIHPWVAGMAAHAAIRAGDREKAAALLGVKDDTSLVGSRLARMLGGVYRESVAAALGSGTERAAQLVQLADAAEEAGLPIVAAAALDQAAILGDRSVLKRLAHLTASFDGREQRLLHAYARAAADDTVDDSSDGTADDKTDDRAQQLLKLGEAAGAAGYQPLAARCFERARELFEQRRDNAGVRQAVHGLAAASGGGRDAPAGAGVLPLPAGVRLTPREAAVVKLAAAGLSNREIAERQSVSVRTVEGHLYRIYAKSGITRREDLLPLAQED